MLWLMVPPPKCWNLPALAACLYNCCPILYSDPTEAYPYFLGSEWWSAFPQDKLWFFRSSKGIHQPEHNLTADALRWWGAEATSRRTSRWCQMRLMVPPGLCTSDPVRWLRCAHQQISPGRQDPGTEQSRGLVGGVSWGTQGVWGDLEGKERSRTGRLGGASHKSWGAINQMKKVG